MAEKRMFAQQIVNSDAFIEMPLSAQALYFHLSMKADDDGFINNPKTIQRMVGADDDDLNVLMEKNFVICFDSGVLVIKHWRINNYIRGDRKKTTAYSEEMALLTCKDNGAYTLNESLCQSNVRQVTVKCPSSDSQMSGKCQATDGIDKNSIDKNSIDKNNNNHQNLREVKSNRTEFEELWNIYPRKQGKAKALQCYIRAKNKGTTFEEVKKGIEAYILYIQREKVETQYIKQGSTFFSQQAWNDDWGTGSGVGYAGGVDLSGIL